MTAPTTILVTGDWIRADGTVADGEVIFTPIDVRWINNGNIIDRVPAVAALTAGAISRTLVQAPGGYQVTEIIGGQILAQYVILGTGNTHLGFTATANTVGITATVRTQSSTSTAYDTVGIFDVPTNQDGLGTDVGDQLVTDQNEGLLVF